MRCKGCGEEMPDAEPKVIERVVTKEVEVDHSENYYYVRVAMWIALVFMMLIVTLAAGSAYENYVYSKTISEPTIKVEITEYDGNGRVVKKFTR